MEETETTEPTVEELAQEEPGVHEAVPVRVEGPVRAQLPGSRIGVMRQVPLGTTAETILGDDLRRRRAVIIASAAIRLGRRTDVEADAAFVLGANIPLELQHTDAVWGRTDTSTADVSILVEQWAD